MANAVDEDYGPVRDEAGNIATDVVRDPDFFLMETFYSDGTKRDILTCEDGAERDDFVQRASDAGLKVVVTPQKYGDGT